MTSPAAPAADDHEVRALPSREASNSLLAILRDGRGRPGAWGRFLWLATARSVHQARSHPRAFTEATLIHVVAGACAGRRGVVWVASSWFMAVTHLGMLGDRTSLGIPNALTLARGTLPALDHRLGAALPVLSLATDFADGKLARATGTVTPFGTQADFLADTAFWTWYIVKHEPSRALGVLTLAAWAAPVVGITVASIVAGRMLDAPRSVWFRPAAAMEIVLGARAVLRSIRSIRSR